MGRRNVNTTLDEKLYTQIKILALKSRTNANDLIEEGMRYVLDKYQESDIHKTPPDA